MTPVRPKEINAVVGIVKSSGGFEYAGRGRIGTLFGEPNFFGARNRAEAIKYLNDEVISVAFISRDTHGEVDYVGDPLTPEQTYLIEEEYLRTNPEGEVEADESGPSEGPRRPVSQIQSGEVPAGSIGPTPLNQPESDLVLRFQKFLGRDLVAGSVKHDASRTRLRYDALDESTGMLLEAKSSAGRTFVLQAIAQLLDYSRLVDGVKRRVVLVPSKPEPDLFELAKSQKIEICYEVDGEFETGL